MWVFIFVYLIVNAGEDRALPIVTTEKPDQFDRYYRGSDVDRTSQSHSSELTRVGV